MTSRSDDRKDCLAHTVGHDGQDAGSQDHGEAAIQSGAQAVSHGQKRRNSRNGQRKAPRGGGAEKVGLNALYSEYKTPEIKQCTVAAKPDWSRMAVTSKDTYSKSPKVSHFGPTQCDRKLVMPL